MRQYFSQFGDISRLRLSRNRQTGQSKHFAFIEFKSSEVAQIVADTMDNYLLFGHILKCKLASKEALHPNTFENANRRFKKVPWNKIEGRRMATGKDRETWEKKIQKENGKRAKKQKAMAEFGYDFDLPTLKKVEDVPVKEHVEELDAAGDAKMIEGAPTGNGDVVQTTTITDTSVPDKTVISENVTKTKKTKKAKTPAIAEENATAKAAATVPKDEVAKILDSKKDVKSKKAKGEKEVTADVPAPKANKNSVGKVAKETSKLNKAEKPSKKSQKAAA